MRKNFLIVFALALLLPALVLAQSNPKDGYQGYVGENQSRNIPAGTVADPGSHLTYIIDTGVNARTLFGTAINAEAVTNNVLADLGIGMVDATGVTVLDPSKVYQNFISITNTHPTQAVTVHFRYFNDNCEDLLDFLVVLTCNDTLIFDPFNFEIPGSSGENTRDRIFGPGRAGKVLEPITTKQFGSGRFVITAAASGANGDDAGSMDDNAEILFPFEMRSLTGECNIQQAVAASGSTAAIAARFTDAALTLNETLKGSKNSPKIVNVGTTAGLSANNLHVFNASQISFNYLVGHLTTAQPAAAGIDQTSWGMSAWVRPAIDRTPAVGDLDRTGISGFPDGDGPQALTGKILLGGEIYKNAANQNTGLTNFLYLRNEVHGGDVHAVGNGGFSIFGALGTQSLHPVQSQWIHLLSVQDDYNGSNNANVGTLFDRSANISPAFTTYILQIYDNNEDILTLPTETPLNVSPPRPGAVLDLEVVCFCLRTFLTTTVDDETSVDDISIADLEDFFSVLSAKGDFDGLLKPVAPDQSGGWIRFVRDNTVTPDESDGVVDIPNATGNKVNDAIGGPFASGVKGQGPGTATAISADGKLTDTSFGPSFLTIGQHVLKFEGFGVSFYLNAVASDAAVANAGQEVAP